MQYHIKCITVALSYYDTVLCIKIVKVFNVNITDHAKKIAIRFVSPHFLGKNYSIVRLTCYLTHVYPRS